MSYIPATSPVPLPLGGAYAPAQSPVPLPLSGAAGGIEPVQRGYAVPVLSFTATGPAQAEFTLPGPVEVAGEAITQQNMFDLPQLSIAAEMTHTPYYYWFGDTSEITSGQPWRHQHWNLVHDYIFDKTLEAYGTADTNRHCDFVDADRQGDFIFWNGSNSVSQALGQVFVTNRRVYVINSTKGQIYYADLDDGVAPESFSRYEGYAENYGGGVGNLSRESIPIYVHGRGQASSDKIYFFGHREGIYCCDVLPDGNIGYIGLSSVPLPWGDDDAYWAYDHFVTPVVCSDTLYVFRDSVVDGSVAWTKINPDGTLQGSWQYKPLTSSRSRGAQYIYVRSPNRYKHDRLYRFGGNTCNDPNHEIITIPGAIDYVEINKATGEILTNYEDNEISFTESRDLFEAYPTNQQPLGSFGVVPSDVTQGSQDYVNRYGLTINACSTGRYLLCGITASGGSSESAYYRVLTEIQDDASFSVFIPCVRPTKYDPPYQHLITSSRIYSFCSKFYDGTDRVHYGNVLNLSERKADKFLTGETVSGELLGGSDNLVTFDPDSPKYVLRRTRVGGGEVPAIDYRIPATKVLAKAEQKRVDYIWPGRTAIIYFKEKGIKVSEYPPGTTLAKKTEYIFQRTKINGYHRLPGWNEGHYYIPKTKITAYGIRTGAGQFDGFIGYMLPVQLAVYGRASFTPPVLVDYIFPGPVTVQGEVTYDPPYAVDYIFPGPITVQGEVTYDPPYAVDYVLPQITVSGLAVPVETATVQYDLPLSIRISGQARLYEQHGILKFEYILPRLKIQGFVCGSTSRGAPVALYKPRLLWIHGEAVYHASQVARGRVKLPMLEIRQGKAVPGAVLTGRGFALRLLRVKAKGEVNAIRIDVVWPQIHVHGRVEETGNETGKDTRIEIRQEFRLPLLDVHVAGESAQAHALQKAEGKAGMGYVIRPLLFNGYGIFSPAMDMMEYVLADVVRVEAITDRDTGELVLKFNRALGV